MQLSEEEKSLVEEATRAFREDFRYLEAVVIAAQSRKESDKALTK